MNEQTQDTGSTISDNPAATKADLSDTAGSTGEDNGSTTDDTASAAPDPRPWHGASSMDVHVKLEALYAWTKSEIDALKAQIGGDGQSENVDTPPAKEA